MSHKKDKWVEHIEKDLAKAPFKKLLWGVVALMIVIIFYFLDKRPDILGESTNFVKLFLFVLGFVALIKITKSPRNPKYLAYYLSKIGSELPDFEMENSYIESIQNYLNNCSTQVSYLFKDNFENTKYFIDNIISFLNNLNHIILRLNYVYSKGGLNEKVIFLEKRQDISLKFKELANLIHENHSILTQEHVDLTSKILDELKDVPEKPLQKSLLEYYRELWYKLPYKLKYAICVILTFTIFFTGFSKLLIYFKQEDAYSYALVATVALAVYVLPKIERFIARERTKFN